MDRRGLQHLSRHASLRLEGDGNDGEMCHQLVLPNPRCDGGIRGGERDSFSKTGEEFLATPTNTRIRIYGDNEGAIKMKKNRSSKRTMYVDIKHHIIRDVVERGGVDIEYVRSEEQHANVLMKVLDI